MKKLCMLFFAMVFLLVLGFGTSASAYFLNYTDTQSGATIEYGLSLSGTTAEFTINVTSAGSSDWYIGAWNVKLFQSGSPATIGSYSILPATLTGWEPTDGTQNTGIKIWGWSRSDGQSGFYDSNYEGIGANSNPVDYFPGGGIALDSTGTATFTFNFTGLASQTLFTSGMPFQVGYYGINSSNGKTQFNQLSKELSIPEPQSMLLLGVALIGLVGIGRKKIFK